VGLVGWALDLEGKCSGGKIIGDFERLREISARERLRERTRRIRVVMAPKKDSSVGEAAPRDSREKFEVGDCMSGDIAPEE
jgi:hypothetical protein